MADFLEKLLGRQGPLEGFIFDDELPEDRLQELGNVELVVGIPSYNNADTIAHVVRAAATGLAKYFPDEEFDLTANG